MSRNPRRHPPSKRRDRSGPVPRSKPAPASAPVNEPPRELAPGLYLVATPIGNLGDISARAIEVLSGVKLIACEDTRKTRILTSAYGLNVTLTAYHEHNAARVRPRLIAGMKAGDAIALVSDAGTPLVSDPGYKLVRAAIEEGVNITAVPGPSAPLAALMISGLPCDRFLFAGFPPSKPEARASTLAELSEVPATLIFFESAHRLPACLRTMSDILGPREAVVAREITKLHEEVRRGTLSGLADHYAQAGPPKGEVVVLVGPPDQTAKRASVTEIDEGLRGALDAGVSVRDAVAAVAAVTKAPRQGVYARALILAGQKNASADE